MLKDPIRAMNTTMQSYKSFVAQVIFVAVYSVFIIGDLAVIGYDHNNSYEEGNLRQADKLFVVVQSVLDLSIVLGYVILFVFFLRLIGEQEDQLHQMKRNVLVFFLFMLFILTV